MSLPLLVIWWGLGSMGGPLKRARPCWRPGAGTVTRSAEPQMLRCAPGRGSAVKGRPSGAAFLQHDLYSPSALGLDVPPGSWLRPGSRGDSLRGLVHTSPIRPQAVAWWGLGSHIPRSMYTPPPPMAAGPAAKKNAAVVVTHNSGRVFALSNGGCSPRNEPISRPRHRTYVAWGPLQQAFTPTL